MNQLSSFPVLVASTTTAAVGSLATDDELQTLAVSLLALIVREVLYWWRNRKRGSAPKTSLS